MGDSLRSEALLSVWGLALAAVVTFRAAALVAPLAPRVRRHGALDPDRAEVVQLSKGRGARAGGVAVRALWPLPQWRPGQRAGRVDGGGLPLPPRPGGVRRGRRVDRDRRRQRRPRLAPGAAARGGLRGGDRHLSPPFGVVRVAARGPAGLSRRQRVRGAAGIAADQPDRARRRVHRRERARAGAARVPRRAAERGLVAVLRHRGAADGRARRVGASRHRSRGAAGRRSRRAR